MDEQSEATQKLLADLNSALAEVVIGARRSLVQIYSGQGWQQGNGAGTIWQQDGLIITNAHVVARGALKVALPDGRELPAKVLAANPELDIAAIYVEATELPTIELGNAKTLKPGTWVTAVGHPWGVMGAATSGIVIGTGDDFPELPTSKREWIVLSLHLRPGHSGGPLLDADGRLIGINTMINGPDIGFAIPVNVVKRFLKKELGMVEIPHNLETEKVHTF